MPYLNIPSSWQKHLAKELQKPYFAKIQSTLAKEISDGHLVFPPEELVYQALASTRLNKVKVVIIGQDPYHNPGQAMGLCFSVPKTAKRPPSLLNIYKELDRDLGHKIVPHGDISVWADRGVLLLNAFLTVRANAPGSHRNIGWQQFTDSIIQILSQQSVHLVFMLWGNFAKSKKVLIDEKKHLVLESAHPSPLARNAFSGNSHFSKCNTYLKEHQITTIDWDLSEPTQVL